MTRPRAKLPILWGLVALAASLAILPVSAQSVADTVNWPDFLSRHDLLWSKLPTKWGEGAFIGNGQLGAMIYQDGGHLMWEIGRSDITSKDKAGYRVPIGHLNLLTKGKVLDGTMRVDLWNAEAQGVVKTESGQVAWHSLVHAKEMALTIEWSASGGEDAQWQFVPERAANTRALFKKTDPIKPEDLHPAPTTEQDGDAQVTIQQLHDGGSYATAWKKAGSRLFLSVGSSYTAPDAKGEALAAIESAASEPKETFEQSHRDWWHAFYPASFFSIPDTRLESFYWIQMYKLASATRADRPAIDLMGPWFKPSPWLLIWWNLNIQLTYWPVYTSNHLDLGESLTRMLDANAQNLANNAAPWSNDSAAIGRVSGYNCVAKASNEFGDLTWALHNYWLQYRYSMDDAQLRDHLFPLLRRAINYFLHIAVTGPDGHLHLPIGQSPEYPQLAPDTNYNLALFRWGCTTLLATCDRLKIDDPLIPKWREVLEKLTPSPTDDATGLLIGAGLPLKISHRHFSHLFSIFPLYEITWEQPENHDLITKSLDHWIGFKGALQGYSFTGASSICASIGRRDQAVDLLNQFVDKFVQPNTMYLEWGPVIETPLSGARSLQDIVLQSWGDKIRVFPGVPDKWKDVTIRDMRTQGAFLITAVRKAGATSFVQIKSLAGEPCRVQSSLKHPAEWGQAELKPDSGGCVSLSLKAGESVVLVEAGQKPDLTVGPVVAESDRLNMFGSKKPSLPQK